MSEPTLQLQRPMRDYIEYFETLNARSVPLLDKVAAPGFYFKDPFNEVCDIEAAKRIFAHMFEALDNPKFKVIDYGFSQKGLGFIKWNFTFSMRGRPFGFEGMTEVTFDKDGKVISHVDYWDSGEHVYEKVPLLKNVIRFAKSKLAA